MSKRRAPAARTPHVPAPSRRRPARAGSRAGSPPLSPAAPAPPGTPAARDAAAVLHPRLPHWTGGGGCACAGSASPPGRGRSLRGSAGAGPGLPLLAAGGVARGASGLGSADRPGPAQPQPGGSGRGRGERFPRSGGAGGAGKGWERAVSLGRGSHPPRRRRSPQRGRTGRVGIRDQGSAPRVSSVKEAEEPPPCPGGPGSRWLSIIPRSFTPSCFKLYITLRILGYEK